MWMVLFLLVLAQTYPNIQLVDITDSKWRLFDNNGFVTWLTFTNVNGVQSVRAVSTAYPFGQWSFSNHVLSLLAAPGVPFCNFVWTYRDGSGAWNAKGLYLPNANTSSTNVFLIEQII